MLFNNIPMNSALHGGHNTIKKRIGILDETDVASF